MKISKAHASFVPGTHQGNNMPCNINLVHGKKLGFTGSGISGIIGQFMNTDSQQKLMIHNLLY